MFIQLKSLNNWSQYAKCIFGDKMKLVIANCTLCFYILKKRVLYLCSLSAAGVVGCLYFYILYPLTRVHERALYKKYKISQTLTNTQAKSLIIITICVFIYLYISYTFLYHLYIWTIFNLLIFFIFVIFFIFLIFFISAGILKCKTL